MATAVAAKSPVIRTPSRNGKKTSASTSLRWIRFSAVKDSILAGGAVLLLVAIIALKIF